MPPIARRTFVPACTAAAVLVAANALAVPAHATAGSILWVKHNGAPDGTIANAVDDVVNEDGSVVFVTGSVRTASTGDDYGTVAYDAITGNELWSRRHDGPAHAFDRATAIAIDPLGSAVFVTGMISTTMDGGDFGTIAYDAATGAKLWSRHHDGNGAGDVASDIGVSPDGSRVFVTGRSVVTRGGDYTTIAYDAATGAQLWMSRYDGPRKVNDNSRALAVSGSQVFVTGRSRATGTKFDYATVAYDAATETEDWVQRFDGPSDSYPGFNEDDAQAIDVAPDGSQVFVTGYTATGSDELSYTTIAYDAADGSQQWVRFYLGPSRFYAIANAIDVSPDGSVVAVTGDDVGQFSGADYLTVAYDAATGAQMWARRYAGTVPATEDATDVGFSGDGSDVLVTGYSYADDGITPVYATLAYDATSGVKLWRKRFDDGGKSSSSVARALAVGPSAVFVTGQVWHGQNTSYATIAYGLT